MLVWERRSRFAATSKRPLNRGETRKLIETLFSLGMARCVRTFTIHIQIAYRPRLPLENSHMER